MTFVPASGIVTLVAAGAAAEGPAKDVDGRDDEGLIMEGEMLGLDAAALL